MMLMRNALTTLSLVLITQTINASDEVMTEIPFGQIKPAGWLKEQMTDDLYEGFVGKLDDLVPDLIKYDDIYDKNRLTKKVKSKDVGTHNSGHEWEVQFLWWNSETQSNWWDGFLRHALLLESEQNIDQVNEYVQAKLASADDDGYIGIYADDLRYKHSTENGELWAQASLFRGLLAYYEYTQNQVILEAVIKAVNLTMQAYPINASTPFKTTDTFAGVGHGLTFVDILNTLYRITGNSEYLDYAVFLYEDYSKHPQPEEDVKWQNLLNKNYRFHGHGVHTYEHLRALTIAATHTDENRYYAALDAYLTRLEDVTTASGGPIGDEWIAKRHAHETDTGYEYCSIQELLHSYLVLLQKTGDARWASKAEWLVYNAGQGARHPDGKSIAYCKADDSKNMLGHLDMANPQGEMRFKYSPAHQDVAVCCVPNAGRLYPYFLQGMWQKHDDGLVLNLFGPSVLNTTINNSNVKIEQITNYPFEQDLQLRVRVSEKVDFELKVRRPEWADNTEVTGKVFRGQGNYLVFSGDWQDETVIKIQFNSQPKTITTANGLTGIQHGPLLYALPLEHSESTGRSYAPGFVDMFFKATMPNKVSSYVMPSKVDLTQASPLTTYSWDTPPIIQGTLYDSKADQFADVAFKPIGSTILRQVSFAQSPITSQ